MTPFFLILIASIVAMIVGMLWYSPLVLGKPWERLQGLELKTRKDYQAYHRAMLPQHIGAFLATILIAWTLWAILGLMGITKSSGALLLATILWGGLLVPGTLILALYDKKSLKLWAIDVACVYVSMLAMVIMIILLR